MVICKSISEIKRTKSKGDAAKGFHNSKYLTAIIDKLNTTSPDRLEY